MQNKRRRFGVVLGFSLLCVGAAQAASVQLINQDPEGLGLNDPTEVSPVGGNSGTTLGQQRQIAISYAADILASRLDSPVPVRIGANFANSRGSLSCREDRATLGTARPTQYSVNFRDAKKRDVFYPIALANAMRGQRIANGDDIALNFNPQLDEGRANCLGGMRWYYGLDGEADNGYVDFLATAVHELTHGFGFVSTVALEDSTDRQGNQTSAGQFLRASNGVRYPDIFSSFIQDVSLPGQPLWVDMTDERRADSLNNGPNVVWSNSVTNNAAGGILTDGFSQGRVRLFAPRNIDPGSSISHWDTSLSPNQIMEPFATPDASVLSGIGLSACVLENMGWRLINDTRCPDERAVAVASSSPMAEPPSAGPSGNSDSGNSRSDGGGGGGCTVSSDARFDPLWGVLLGVSLVVVGWRRNSRRA